VPETSGAFWCRSNLGQCGQEQSDAALLLGVVGLTGTERRSKWRELKRKNLARRKKKRTQKEEYGVKKKRKARGGGKQGGKQTWGRLKGGGVLRKTAEIRGG